MGVVHGRRKTANRKGHRPQGYLVELDGGGPGQARFKSRTKAETTTERIQNFLLVQVVIIGTRIERPRFTHFCISSVPPAKRMGNQNESLFFDYGDEPDHQTPSRVGHGIKVVL